MGLTASKIKVGKYYRTATNQHRHVTKIENGKVWFSTRGSKGGPWGFGTPTTPEKFAAAVVEEVVASWHVDYPNLKPEIAKARKSAKKTPKAKKVVKAKKTVKKAKKAKRKK